MKFMRQQHADSACCVRAAQCGNDKRCAAAPGPDVFFPDGEATAPAKDICARRPVRSECLAYAIDGKAVGVWGGTSTAERQHAALIRRRTDRRAA